MAGYMSCRAMPLSATIGYETMFSYGRAVSSGR